MERPLYQDRPVSDFNRVHRTSRHQAAAGGRKEGVDPRDKMALAGILRSVIMILVLLILFFLVWKGVTIYEERVMLENQLAIESSPGLVNAAAGVDAMQFSLEGRIEAWWEIERTISAVEELLIRNNYDQAIVRCQDILRITPYNITALEYLGELYLEKGMPAEAIDAYSRLLSVDPSREDVQQDLMKALDAGRDDEAIILAARWYQDRNTYDESVQRYLANAYFRLERYAEAAEAYARVVKDSPRDVQVLENQAVSYMALNQYDQALAVLEQQVGISLRDPECHQRIANCYAQLGMAEETVQILGKSAHLFGPDTVLLWIKDPLMDPIRMDRTFKAFADRVGGEEYRKYLERVAQTLEGDPEEYIAPQIGLSDDEETVPERQ